jgi:hypothetical protein
MIEKIDKVLVSSDCSPMFINYWPVVAKSWKDIFGITAKLILVTRANVKIQLIEKLRDFGEVEVVTQIPEVPIPNQAKLARWFSASSNPNQISSIEDIDTIFLKPDFLRERFDSFDENRLLGIGSEVYTPQQGITKFPASNLTGSGILFSELFGYRDGMSFGEFVKQFRNLAEFDNLEDPYRPPRSFSDESLIRALRKRNNFLKIHVIPRSIDTQNSWLDRSVWPTENELNLHKYTTVNFLRPLRENYAKCKPILDLFYPREYPWILDKRTPIWKNRDHFLKRFPVELLYAFKKLLRRLKFRCVNSGIIQSLFK